jgi:leucyl aminopeptidase
MAFGDNSGMSSASSALPIVASPAPPSGLEADLLWVPWFEGDAPAVVPGLDQATGGEIARALAAKEFAGKTFDVFVTPAVDRSWRSRRVALIGAGRRDAFGGGLLRQLATAAALGARQRRAGTLALVVRSAGHAGVEASELAQAAAEGLALAAFDGARYKTVDPAPAAFPGCVVAFEGAAGRDAARLDAAVARGRLLGECCNQARELCNEPGNALPPRAFAARALEVVAGANIRSEVLDERQMEALNMGMLLGVARGSHEPPRLMSFAYEPAGAPPGPVLGIIGKGVTFDTGGISIKPADGMERMKDDMAGGAAVVGAMRAIGLLEAPIRVVGVVPAAENMPGGRAIRPGDVLTSAEGKTVEVINTDAEGRLLLGDALWYARRLGATHLVDLATLTGAIVVALGRAASGIFGTPDAWVEHVRRTADRSGDRVWPMPLFDEYRDQIKSEIADMINSAGRPASSCTAAMFLKEFTGGLPWAHIDIAGTAWAEEARPYQPKGATGVGVRTLAELPFTPTPWP